MSEQLQPTVTVSLSRSIPVEQYGGKAEALVCLQNIPVSATAEEIDAMLTLGKLTWERMAPVLNEQMKRRIAAIKEDACKLPQPR